MSGTSVVSGLSSGINWRDILDQLREVEHKKIDLVETRKKTYQDRLTAWQAMNTKLLALKTAADTLNETKSLNLYTASLASNTAIDADDVLSVTTSTDAAPGTYQIEVISLAVAQKRSTMTYASQTTALNLSGDLVVGGKTVSIATTDTLMGIRDKINAANTGDDPSGGTASIIKYGDTDYRLILTSDEEGTAGISLANGAGSLVETMGFAEIQPGANASIVVDTVPVTPSSNELEDLITGVTLNLKSAAPGTTITVTVGRDYKAVKEAISGFVTAYNDTIDAIGAQLKYNADTKKAEGVLFGDGTLRNIKSSLVDVIINKVGGVSEGFSTLGLVGINIGNDSKLKIDDDKLQGFLETNFNDIKKLFAADWSSTNSSLSYIYHTIDTQAGTYNVNITGTSPLSGYFVTPGDATGNGQNLSGTSGAAMGLLVTYSGTATGAVGSLKLTFGIAEIMDRALYHVTDSVDGTVVNKKETIQDQIENLDETINRMEDRLDKKMEILERQFIAMESALNKLQSQGSWLSGQINALM